MKRILRSAAVAALFALSACGGSNSAASALGPGSVLPAGAGSSTDFTARLPQNSLGGIPCFSLSISLFDAPLTFSASDHINLAMLGVNLVGNDGVSHPMYMLPKPVVVDLLTLKKNAQQYKTKVAAGTYRAMEFIVLPAVSSVVVGGAAYPVRFGNGAVGSPIPLALDSPVTHRRRQQGQGQRRRRLQRARIGLALERRGADRPALRRQHRRVAGARQGAATPTTSPVAGATILVADAAGKVVNTSVTDKDG